MPKGFSSLHTRPSSKRLISVDGAWHAARILIDYKGIVCYGPDMGEKRHDLVFDPEQMETVNLAVTLAEELVSNHFKMSPNQWLRPKYDVKTLMDLSEAEIIDGPFAQIIRYQGQRKGSALGSDSYDFYKICLQDHTIQKALLRDRLLILEPFSLYIIAHELIHIVRFSKFLQNFEANPDEKLAEEKRVHAITHHICSHIKIDGMGHVLGFYRQWR